MPATILPIDTVQAVWHSAFPSLMRTLWNDPEGADEISRALLHGRDADILGDSPALTTWFRERFAADGIGSGTVFNPFGPGRVTVSTSSHLKATLLVHAGGLVLPCLPDKRPELSDFGFEDPDDEVAKAVLGEGHGWYASLHQIECLRAAASVATVLTWKKLSAGKAKRFEAVTYLDFLNKAWVAALGRPPSFEVDKEVKAFTKQAFNAPGRPGGYYNPEDGAGWFCETGYVVFAPPPPPALDGLFSGYREDPWHDTHGNNCGTYYAARNAYATPCSCAKSDSRIFEMREMPQEA